MVEVSMTVYLAPIGTGLGDQLISLPIVRALLEGGEKVCLVTRSFRQIGLSERVAGVAGEVKEEDLELAEGDKYLNLRAHPIQTDYFWGSPEFEEKFGETRIEKILTVIATDWGLDITFKNLMPLIFNAQSATTGKVVFAPGTDGFFKHWPAAYWLELAARLNNMGQSVVMLGRPSESPAVRELIGKGLPWFATPTSGDAIDAVSSARAIVSVDTGLMHIAVQQNIPTFAFIHPTMFHQRSAACCVNFIGRHCPEACGREEFTSPDLMASTFLDVDLKFGRHVCQLAVEPLEKRLSGAATEEPYNCMSVIKPEQIWSALAEKLKV